MCKGWVRKFRGEGDMSLGKVRGLNSGVGWMGRVKEGVATLYMEVYEEI